MRTSAVLVVLAVTAGLLAACGNSTGASVRGTSPTAKAAAEACAVRWLRLTLHRQYQRANDITIQAVGGSNFSVPPRVPVRRMRFSATSAHRVGDQWVIRTSLGSAAGAGPIVHVAPEAGLPVEGRVDPETGRTVPGCPSSDGPVLVTAFQNA